MRFAVFEEFTTPENLARLDELERLAQRAASNGPGDAPIEVFFAAPSFEAYQALVGPLETAYPRLRFGYWPVLTKDEGYWLSPFAAPVAVARVLHELTARPCQKPLLLLWDAELPIMDPQLLLRYGQEFFLTKTAIEDFFKRARDQNIEIVTAEYTTLILPEWLQQSLGIAFEPRQHGNRKVKMFYTSTKRKLYPLLGAGLADTAWELLFIRECTVNHARYGERFGVGVGCLATGILGTEPVLTVPEFERDLKLAQRLGVARAYIFRLGGMHHAHFEVMATLLQ